jgi:hypothetical protein
MCNDKFLAFYDFERLYELSSNFCRYAHRVQIKICMLCYFVYNIPICLRIT